MKISILALVMFFMISCVGLQLTSQEKQIAGKILARHIGYQLADEYPDIAAQITPVLEQIVNAQAESSAQLIEILVSNILNQIDISDPLLKADIGDLCELLELRIPEIKLENERVKMIKIIARSMLEGIKLGGEK